MKILTLWLVLAALLLNIAAAQTEVAPPLLPEPLSTTTPDNTRYLNKPDLLKPCAERVAAIKGQPCDLIFIGDSITELWLKNGKEIWDRCYAPRQALDFGIGGDKTQNVLWRLDHLDVKELRPKVAVVLIGTNNGKNTPQEIADGVKAVLDKTQANFHEVKIILVSIMPSRRGLKKMNEVDVIIKGYADGKMIYWLDLVPLMPPVPYTTADGKTGMTWKGIGTRDLLHPDATGYQIWSDAMEPLLTKLLSDETK